MSQTAEERKALDEANTITLKNVRLSYSAYLFKPEKDPKKPDAKPTYSSTFILDKVKHKALIAEIQAKIATLVKTQLKGAKPAAVCLRDGSERGDKDGYGENVMFIGARHTAKPPVVDKNPTVAIDPESGKVHAGCYVNARIRLWAQIPTGENASWGKKINARLLAVQYAGPGEPFGESAVKPDECFETLPEDDSGI